MTNAKDAQGGTGALDTLLLALTGAAVLAGIVAYYYFEDAPLVLRVLAVIGGLGAGLGLLYQTQQGKTLWHFIQGSRIEMRKVVWPTRQETMQTTLSVLVFVLILGVFFWLLDMGLMRLMAFSRAVAGQGG